MRARRMERPRVPDRQAPLPPAYWRLWTASTISNLGDGVFIVALPLLAARLTRSELSIAFIGVAAALPWLLLSLPIGAMVDRGDHRGLMVRADAFRTIVIGGLAIAVAADHARVWMLWVVAAGLGIAEVFFDNASQSIVPAIVEEQLLEKANGRRFAAETAANNFVGTLIGSVLFAAALWLPFGVDAASFAIAAVLVLTLRLAAGPAREKAPHTTTLRTEIAEGLRWLFRHRVLRGLAVTASVSVVGMQMTAAIYVLFAQDFLHISDRWYGALIAVGAVGAVVGGLVAERTVKLFGILFSLYAIVVMWIVCMFAEGFWPRLWVGFTATAAMAFATTVWNTITISLRQRVVPSHLFGRVNSVYRWVVWGSVSIGAAIGGVVSRWWGLRAPFYIGAVFGAIGLLVLATSVTPARLETLRSRLSLTDRSFAEDDTPVAIDADWW
jgi:MFS family permease